MITPNRIICSNDHVVEDDGMGECPRCAEYEAEYKLDLLERQGVDLDKYEGDKTHDNA